MLRLELLPIFYRNNTFHLAGHGLELMGWLNTIDKRLRQQLSINIAVSDTWANGSLQYPLQDDDMNDSCADSLRLIKRQLRGYRSINAERSAGSKLCADACEFRSHYGKDMWSFHHRVTIDAVESKALASLQSADGALTNDGVHRIHQLTHPRGFDIDDSAGSLPDR